MKTWKIFSKKYLLLIPKKELNFLNFYNTHFFNPILKSFNSITQQSLNWRKTKL